MEESDRSPASIDKPGMRCIQPLDPSDNSDDIACSQVSIVLSDCGGRDVTEWLLTDLSIHLSLLGSNTVLEVRRLTYSRIFLPMFAHKGNLGLPRESDRSGGTDR